MNRKPDINIDAGMVCPIPMTEYKNVLLAHGSGGKLTHQLIQKVFLSQFMNPVLEPLHDGALLNIGGSRLAFSTDSFVVNPIFFPGGNIGELAVNGTVNDLAVCGAEPMFISAAFIIEEGLPVDDLWRIVVSMQEAAKKAGVQLVTGDTKVVDRGKADKIFINTSGIGLALGGVDINPKNIQAGDAILLSGTIADHGIAIMSVREGLEFETQIRSDTAALNGLVHVMLSASNRVRVMRDATRGGVASVLNELAESSHIGLRIREESIPVKEEVRGACEILGFDPLYVANEGKLVAVVPRDDEEAVLNAMRSHPLGVDAQIIGEATSDHAGTVVMRSRIGGTRVVDMLSGEQLPRIC